MQQLQDLLFGIFQIFFSNIFNLWFIEAVDVELIGIKGQPFLFFVFFLRIFASVFIKDIVL